MELKQQHKKEILLICGSFTSANYYVMLSVIRSLGNVHIHAISANNDDPHRVPCYDDVTYYHIHNWRISFLSAIKKIPISILSRTITYIFYRITELYDNYFTSVYERAIYKQSKAIVEKECTDAIFSVCLRFYTHRIALKLNKKTGIPWFQFWVDPFSNRKNGSKMWLSGAKKLERRFLSEASTIYALPEVFVYSDIIDDYKEKLVTFEIPYLVNREVQTTTKDIIFAGGFIKGVREPEPVLDLLQSICGEIDGDVRFHFYVQNKDHFSTYTNRSKGRICFHDYVGHEELYSLLSNSYMLLNIGNAGSIQMPSKTVEYVSFRKPLLFFYKDDNDPSLRYLTNYPDICRIKIDDDSTMNSVKLIDYINGAHKAISYNELIKIQCFRESTPDYIKKELEAI